MFSRKRFMLICQ